MSKRVLASKMQRQIRVTRQGVFGTLITTNIIFGNQALALWRGLGINDLKSEAHPVLHPTWIRAKDTCGSIRQLCRTIPEQILERDTCSPASYAVH